MRSKRIALFLLLAVAVAVAIAAFLGLQNRQRSADAPSGSTTDPLTAMGFSVTSGAAPGYVEDRACALCHQGLAEEYQQVGMARSFYRPTPEHDIETFAAADDSAASFHHAASGMSYQMQRRGERLVFQQWQPAADGTRQHEFEIDVDWIMGSGHTSRVYLAQTPAGELYQLPLAWYTQGAGWGMSPGFEGADHGGLTRRVRRECMFCHNGYPDVAEGSDQFGAPHTFPTDLPEGIGCQRCHGPGAEHSRLALSDASDDDVRDSILDPIDLSTALMEDVCHQCHLQPTVMLPGIRPFGVGDYAFRPGSDLGAYLLHPEVEEAGRTTSERFEINHHPYRLEQSPCFVASPAGSFSCLTCHDPHRKLAPARRIEHYERVCQSCHDLDACQLQAMTAEQSADLPQVSARDCTACHMPKRRTQDVVHVAMTDHQIQRRPPAGALDPLEKSHPTLTELSLYQPEQLPDEIRQHADLYSVSALVRLSGAASPAGIDHLDRLLQQGEVSWPEPYLDLAHGRLLQRRPDEATKALTQALARLADGPSDSHARAQALEWRALALAGKGHESIAIEQLRELLQEYPDRFEARFNLARLLREQGELDAAREQYEHLLEQRPWWPDGHYWFAQLLQDLQLDDEALEHYRRALQLSPNHVEAARAVRDLG